MAIYTLQTAIDQPIGSTGGITFQKSGTSFAIRNRAKPVLKRTPAQTVVRNKFESVSQHWRTLNGTQQGTFTTEAPNYPRTNSLGDPYTLSANNLQNSSNQMLVTKGIARIDSIPSPQAFTPLGAGTFTVDTGVPEIFLYDSPAIIPANESRAVFLSMALQPGADDINAQTLLLIHTFLAGEDSSINLYNFWAALFQDTNFTPGNQMFGKTLQILNTTGQIGTTATANVKNIS
jgi:hypothetical protein